MISGLRIKILRHNRCRRLHCAAMRPYDAEFAGSAGRPLRRSPRTCDAGRSFTRRLRRAAALSRGAGRGWASISAAGRRRAPSSSLAGRSLGWLPLGLSLAATLLASGLSSTSCRAWPTSTACSRWADPAVAVADPAHRGLSASCRCSAAWRSTRSMNTWSYRFDARVRLAASLLFIAWRLLWLGAVSACMRSAGCSAMAARLAVPACADRAAGNRRDAVHVPGRDAGGRLGGRRARGPDAAGRCRRDWRPVVESGAAIRARRGSRRRLGRTAGRRL